MPTLEAKHSNEISKQGLLKAAYGFSSSFSLSLADQQESLHCTEVLRLIPKKRLVAFANWKNQTVVAKIFFGSKAKARMQADLNGIKALQAAKIPSPAIYYDGKAEEAGVFVIIFERILNAENLGTFWQNQKTQPQSEEALHSLTVELATQHVMGLMQKDLHLNNFLLGTDKIYTLDGGDILLSDEPLSKKHSLENLALLFSQLGIYSNRLQQRLFLTYINSRSWLVEKADLQHLHKSLRQWNLSRWLSFRKKIFRSSSQFCKSKKLCSHLIYDRQYQSASFEKFLQNPDSFFTLPDTLVLKEGRSSTVAKINIDGRALVVKRYNIKDSWHQLKRCFQKTRAECSWTLSHQMQFVGLPTAKPVGYLEKRFLNCRGKSYFIMEYIEGTRADQFFEQYGPESSENRLVAQKIVSLFFNLARLRLSHGDLKITNLIIKPNFEPLLIDLDSMREHQSSLGLAKRFRKDMERFLENWRSNPTMHQLFQELIVNLGKA